MHETHSVQLEIDCEGTHREGTHCEGTKCDGIKMLKAAFRRPPCIVHATGLRQSLRRAHFFLPAFLAVFLAAFFAVFFAAFFAAFFLAAMVGSLELVTLLVSE